VRVRARLLGPLTAALAAASVAAALLSAPASAADSTPPDWTQLDTCVLSATFQVRLPDTGGFVAHDPLYGYTYDGGLLTRAAWEHPTSTDAVENLEGYGLTWMQPLLRAVRDAGGDPERIDWLVEQLVGTLAWRPDNGSRTDVVWSEGVNLRREQGLNCLYSVTRDARLVPVMAAVAAANMDPDRYYGPPRWPPHNHGLMANLALLRSGVLLGREDWRNFAVSRMRTAIDASFTAAGVTIEQSVAYGGVILSKWREAAKALRQSGQADELTLAAHIDDEVAHAAAAYNFLLQPDDVPVPIGDQRAPRTSLTAQRSTALVDREAGIVASRWSWAAPDDWYAVRFGKPTAMHGHQDRMSVVWWSTGRPVLVDPATATYTAGPARTWSLAPASHNVPIVAGGSYAPWVPVTLDAYAHRTAADTLLLTGSLYRVHQHRRITVDPVHDRLTVLDTGARPVNQVWQLDPRWRLRSYNGTRTAARFVDATGASLLVTTTGRIASVLKGASGLAGGWVFSYPPAARTAAARMVVVGSTSTTTTFTVTGPALTPWTA
jgi:hypothetical protein